MPGAILIPLQAFAHLVLQGRNITISSWLREKPRHTGSRWLIWGHRTNKQTERGHTLTLNNEWREMRKTQSSRLQQRRTRPESQGSRNVQEGVRPVGPGALRRSSEMKTVKWTLHLAILRSLVTSVRTITVGKQSPIEAGWVTHRKQGDTDSVPLAERARR